jgi:phosphoribosylformylglycinamidine synthase
MQENLIKEGDFYTLVVSCAIFPKQGFEKGLNRFPLYWLKIRSKLIKDIKDFADSELLMVVSETLRDPLLQNMHSASPQGRSSWAPTWEQEGFQWLAEKQFLPGVTDNLGKTVEEALSLRGFSDVQVASGEGFLFPKGCYDSKDEIETAGLYHFHHPLTDRFVVHKLGALEAGSFLSFPDVHLPEPTPPQTVPLDLDDAGLLALSKQRLLALNPEEMQAIRAHFETQAVQELRASKGLPGWPTDVELEVLAQTWSEHCKHKIFNACIEHQDNSLGGATQEIDSLYKTYIQGPTFALKDKRTDLLSVFEDNSGVVRWNDEFAVCFKVETHNSPSALEPYGGALTGILGVNRDVLGTGLGAKPIFNTDVFCFAYPSDDLPRRPKLLPADTIMNGVRKGVQDGGNKSGIPTVNGAICFHNGYRAKPLVFCGTGGLLPTTVAGKSGFQKHTRSGDTIVMVGGRVGKDGIHGATFSSEQLHEGSPVSAVQIGDPFTQKRVLDFILEARDMGLITGITDNGAGGLSSSVGEMAQITGGATMELDNIPLKYPGLADYEIVISESQERMTISTRAFEELKWLAERFNVEATAIGQFHDQGYFEITRDGKQVALLDLKFLHKGNPRLHLKSEWSVPHIKDTVGAVPEKLEVSLMALLSHPNICSRENVIRQYDHEVQAGSVVKPLMGPMQQAPCDAAVFKPLYNEEAALVVSNGLAPYLSEFDAYLMALCAVDEAVRNAVAVGADPATITLLDNFCWPDPVEGKRNATARYKLAQLVRACQALADICQAYQTPLISGKDSMKNDFDDGVVQLSVPPTLLVSAMGKIADANLAISMDYKAPGDIIYLLSAGKLGLAGSQYTTMHGWLGSSMPSLDLAKARAMYGLLHEMIKQSKVQSCHDVSDGGIAVALAESAIGSGYGAHIDGEALTAATGNHDRADFALFAEGPAHLIVTISPEHEESWQRTWNDFTATRLGTVSDDGKLSIKGKGGHKTVEVAVKDLMSAWQKMLPFE